MTVEEFNNTPDGRRLKARMEDLYALQREVLDEVRRKTEPKAFGSYVDYDDSGFFDNTEI